VGLKAPFSSRYSVDALLDDGKSISAIAGHVWPLLIGERDRARGYDAPTHARLYLHRGRSDRAFAPLGP